ncbi:hypothetical protein GW17_00057890 [Ensete ventricosum]|nr:hypothetical protein GW17_00057890 [Ensete ventricosum]
MFSPPRAPVRATTHCLSLLYKEGTTSSFSLSNDGKSTTAVLLSLPFKSIAHHLPLLLCWQRRLGCQPSLLAIATGVNLTATAALVSSSSAEISDATSRSVTTTASTSTHPLLLPRHMTEGYIQLQHPLPSPSASSSSQDSAAGRTPLLPSSTNSKPICCLSLPAIAASIAAKALTGHS